MKPARKGISLRPAAVVFGALLLFGQLTAPGFGAEPAATASANLDEVVDLLQQHYQTTKSFTANFNETITRAGTLPMHRSGVIQYRRPGKFRWEFRSPQPETVISDGTTIYDYDPGLNQVVETPLTRAFQSAAAAAFLLGAGNLKRDFTAEPLEPAGSSELIHLSLTPKRGGQRFEVGIEPKTYNIATLSISDPMGNRTDLSFSNIRLNHPLEDAQFSFTPPNGADIVKPGGQ